MKINDQQFQDFLSLSVELTAFSEFDLLGTGYASTYYQTIQTIIGDATLTELLTRYRMLAAEAGDDQDLKERLLRIRLMSSKKLGPITRNIIKVWYLSTWYELPLKWRDEFGTLPNDGTFVVDAWAYPEGLLWRAVGAHPPGAKPPGYGSWTEPPVIPAMPAN